MLRTTHNAADVNVGDVIAYPAAVRERAPSPRDWLKVTRVEKGFVYGTRMHPQEPDDTEYAVYPVQIIDNGVVIEQREQDA